MSEYAHMYQAAAGEGEALVTLPEESNHVSRLPASYMHTAGEGYLEQAIGELPRLQTVDKPHCNE